MNIEFWQIGKIKQDYLQKEMAHYSKFIKRFCKFNEQQIPSAQGKSVANPTTYKSIEAKNLLKLLDKNDKLILLDERGTTFTSIKFASWLQRELDQSPRRLIFVIGGAYGFDSAIYAQAHAKISLSELTFPHQLVRLFFLEQLYRAFTILNNQNYHH